MPVVFVDRQIVGHESARALTLTEGRPPGGVWALPGWDEALFEVQDAGSQAIVEACGDGFSTALDMCAGNGGKSIPLAARCQELWCHDVDTERLKRLRARARRAGAGPSPPRGASPSAPVCRSTRSSWRKLPQLRSANGLPPAPR